jgi:hypothetical protein
MMLGVVLLLLSGCDTDDDVRKPIPVLEIEILADADEYVLNDQRMDYEHLKSELRRVADETRRDITNSCRAYVRLNVRRGASTARADDLITFCSRIGLDQIENRASGN